MFLVMKAFESSGQTQRSFCEAHGLSRSTFQYWLRRYRQSTQEAPSAQAGFISLEVGSGPGSTSAAGIVIIYADGTRLEINRLVEACFIRQLLVD